MFSCFTDKIFLKRFFKISFPVMIAGFITFLVSFIDNIMVGTISNDAVSGVYAANEVTYIFNLAIFGILEGSGIFIQQFLGSKDTKRLKESFHYKILITLIFMLIAMPIIYFFGKNLIYFYSKNDANCSLIYNEGVKYLNIVAISYIPYSIGYIYSSTLKEIGKTKIPMYSSIMALIINIIFNSLFILGLKMGVTGAALATIMARIAEMLVIIIASHIKKYDFCSNILNFKIEWNLTKKITVVGIPLFINELGFTFGMVLQSLAFSQRDGVLSSISIVTTIANIFNVLVTGLSTGIGVMVGSDLGAGEYDKAISDNKKLNLLGIYMSILFGIILISLSSFIPNIFKEVTLEQKQIASFLIIIHSALLWAGCLAMTSYMTLKVGGKSGLTFIFDSGTMILVYIPLSWILALLTNINIIYFYLIIRGLDVLKALFGVYLMKRKTWVQNLTKIEGSL